MFLTPFARRCFRFCESFCDFLFRCADADADADADAVSGDAGGHGMAVAVAGLPALRSQAALRRFACNQRPAQGATALVHEAWIRLLGQNGNEQAWGNRAHFFGAAAEAMRRILIDPARKKKRVKHRGELKRVQLGGCPDTALRKPQTTPTRASGHGRTGAPARPPKEPGGARRSAASSS
jgi:hypothetical protein